MADKNVRDGQFEEHTCSYPSVLHSDVPCDHELTGDLTRAWRRAAVG